MITVQYYGVKWAKDKSYIVIEQTSSLCVYWKDFFHYIGLCGQMMMFAQSFIASVRAQKSSYMKLNRPHFRKEEIIQGLQKSCPLPHWHFFTLLIVPFQFSIALDTTLG